MKLFIVVAFSLVILLPVIRCEELGTDGKSQKEVSEAVEVGTEDQRSSGTFDEENQKRNLSPSSTRLSNDGRNPLHKIPKDTKVNSSSNGNIDSAKNSSQVNSNIEDTRVENRNISNDGRNSSSNHDQYSNSKGIEDSKKSKDNEIKLTTDHNNLLTSDNTLLKETKSDDIKSLADSPNANKLEKENISSGTDIKERDTDGEKELPSNPVTSNTENQQKPMETKFESTKNTSPNPTKPVEENIPNNTNDETLDDSTEDYPLPDDIDQEEEDISNNKNNEIVDKDDTNLLSENSNIDKNDSPFNNTETQQRKTTDLSSNDDNLGKGITSPNMKGLDNEKVDQDNVLNTKDKEVKNLSTADQSSNVTEKPANNSTTSPNSGSVNENGENEFNPKFENDISPSTTNNENESPSKTLEEAKENSNVRNSSDTKEKPINAEKEDKNASSENQSSKVPGENDNSANINNKENVDNSLPNDSPPLDNNNNNEYINRTPIPETTDNKIEEKKELVEDISPANSTIHNENESQREILEKSEDKSHLKNSTEINGKPLHRDKTGDSTSTLSNPLPSSSVSRSLDEVPEKKDNDAVMKEELPLNVGNNSHYNYTPPKKNEPQRDSLQKKKSTDLQSSKEVDKNSRSIDGTPKVDGNTNEEQGYSENIQNDKKLEEKNISNELLKNEDDDDDDDDDEEEEEEEEENRDEEDEDEEGDEEFNSENTISPKNSAESLNNASTQGKHNLNNNDDDDDDNNNVDNEDDDNVVDQLSNPTEELKNNDLEKSTKEEPKSTDKSNKIPPNATLYNEGRSVDGASKETSHTRSPVTENIQSPTDSLLDNKNPEVENTLNGNNIQLSKAKKPKHSVLKNFKKPKEIEKEYQFTHDSDIEPPHTAVSNDNNLQKKNQKGVNNNFESRKNPPNIKLKREKTSAPSLSRKLPNTRKINSSTNIRNEPIKDDGYLEESNGASQNDDASDEEPCIFTSLPLPNGDRIKVQPKLWIVPKKNNKVNKPKENPLPVSGIRGIPKAIIVNDDQVSNLSTDDEIEGQSTESPIIVTDDKVSNLSADDEIEEQSTEYGSPYTQTNKNIPNRSTRIINNDISESLNESKDISQQETLEESNEVSAEIDSKGVDDSYRHISPSKSHSLKVERPSINKHNIHISIPITQFLSREDYLINKIRNYKKLQKPNLTNFFDEDDSEEQPGTWNENIKWKKDPQNNTIENTPTKQLVQELPVESAPHSLTTHPERSILPTEEKSPTNKNVGFTPRESENKSDSIINSKSSDDGHKNDKGYPQIPKKLQQPVHNEDISSEHPKIIQNQENIPFTDEPINVPQPIIHQKMKEADDENSMIRKSPIRAKPRRKKQKQKPSKWSKILPEEFNDNTVNRKVDSASQTEQFKPKDNHIESQASQPQDILQQTPKQALKKDILQAQPQSINSIEDEASNNDPIKISQPVIHQKVPEEADDDDDIEKSSATAKPSSNRPNEKLPNRSTMLPKVYNDNIVDRKVSFTPATKPTELNNEENNSLQATPQETSSVIKSLQFNTPSFIDDIKNDREYQENHPIRSLLPNFNFLDNDTEKIGNPQPQELEKSLEEDDSNSSLYESSINVPKEINSGISHANDSPTSNKQNEIPWQNNYINPTSPAIGKNNNLKPQEMGLLPPSNNLESQFRLPTNNIAPASNQFPMSYPFSFMFQPPAAYQSPPIYQYPQAQLPSPIYQPSPIQQSTPLYQSTPNQQSPPVYQTMFVSLFSPKKQNNPLDQQTGKQHPGGTFTRSSYTSPTTSDNPFWSMVQKVAGIGMKNTGQLLQGAGKISEVGFDLTKDTFDTVKSLPVVEKVIKPVKSFAESGLDVVDQTVTGSLQGIGSFINDRGEDTRQLRSLNPSRYRYRYRYSDSESPTSSTKNSNESNNPDVEDKPTIKPLLFGFINGKDGQARFFGRNPFPYSQNWK